MAALCLFPAGCGQGPERGVVARVGRTKLTLEGIERRTPVQLAGRLTAADRRHLVDAWVEQELLVQEAVARGLHEDPVVSRRLADARREILTAELLEREVRMDADVGQQAIRAYYESRRDEFIREQTEIRVRHILVPGRPDQDRVQARLDQGELFDQVAREESIDESAERGGDLGYFTEDMVDPNLWAACVDAPLNRSVQVRTRLGYHLVEVLDRREAGVARDLSEVTGEIRQRLLAERRQARRDSLIEAVRSRVKVTIDAGLLEGGS